MKILKIIQDDTILAFQHTCLMILYHYNYDVIFVLCKEIRYYPQRILYILRNKSLDYFN